MAGTMIQLHAIVLPFGGGRAECGSPGAAFTTAVSIRFSGSTDGPLWIAGSVIAGQIIVESSKEQLGQ